MSEAALVECVGASRVYGNGSAATLALEPCDCRVEPRQRIALMGPSGSGKSTLLHLMAGLDQPTQGRVDWPAIGPREALRPGPVAVVFQGPSLLPPLTILENVQLPLILNGSTPNEAAARAENALEVLGLTDLSDKLPEEVSGGQAQRAAVARALAGKPTLLLADEPTGQLDHAAAREVVDALLATAEASGGALVVATHDREVAAALGERWEIHSGRLGR
ncbi:MAG TPA: ATP-binding cassette domain-containing protein [Thermoleophilaceae bacterium]|nr:ATP-binding cassette domain-containing protein [Thermoleophilaceae bacterium]